MRVVLLMAPLEFWSPVNLCLGALQFVALAVNHKGVRWVGSVSLCMLWGIYTAGVWAAQPWTPMPVPFGVLCGINLYSILRLPFKR